MNTLWLVVEKYSAAWIKILIFRYMGYHNSNCIIRVLGNCERVHKRGLLPCKYRENKKIHDSQVVFT